MSNNYFCNFCRIQFADETEFFSHWQLLHSCERPNSQQNPVIKDFSVFDNAGSSLRSQNNDLETKDELLRQSELRSAHAPPELFPSFQNYFYRNKQFERLGGSTEGLLKCVNMLQKLQPQPANSCANPTPIAPPTSIALPTPIAPPTLSVSASGSSERLGDNRESLLETISWLQKMTSAPPTKIDPPAQPLYRCVFCNMNFQDQNDFENHLIVIHRYTGK